MEIFGKPIIEILNALHGIAGFTLLVALIMGGIFLFFVSKQNWKHITVAGNTAAISYLITFILGLLIYPIFRVETRAAILDSQFPQATGIFEIKEHLAALAAFVAISMLVLGLFGYMKKASTARKMVYGTFATILGILSVTLFILGFTFTSYY